MAKREFEAKFLREVIEDSGYVGVEVFENKLIDQSRWETYYSLIFRFEEKLYQLNYSRGSTEIQEHDPLEYHDCKCEEVVPVRKLVTRYLPISEVVVDVV